MHKIEGYLTELGEASLSLKEQLFVIQGAIIEGDHRSRHNWLRHLETWADSFHS